MRVIPAIDLVDGRPVRLAEGDSSRMTSFGLSALDAAKRFEDGGLGYLHLVDLDAAFGRGSNLDVLEEIASKTSLHIDFGGGVRTPASFLSALDAGAAEVNIGSMAAKDPDAVKALAAEFPSRVILSADARDGRIAVSGWTEDTGADAVSFIGDFLASGIGKAVVTDISSDGMLSGPSLELYRTILEKLPGLSLIASGGVSSLDDLKALAGIGCSGAIVGKAYYEGRISIEEMKEAECWRRG